MPALQEQLYKERVGPLRGVRAVPPLRLDRQRNRTEEEKVMQCGHPMSGTLTFIVIRAVDTSPWQGYECQLCGAQWKRRLPPMTVRHLSMN